MTLVPPLVRILADGRFHSGDHLGRSQGVGRAAVWKQVHALRSAGISIDSVRGKGYRIAGGLDLLDANEIRRGLGSVAAASFPEIQVFDVVDSTNAVALSRARAPMANGYVCFAEQQTAGRGRRGRHWVSPFAANIYLTVVCEFAGGFGAIQGLSIAVGVAVCEAIESLGVVDVRLKWPNDLVCNGRKLGGILIEVVGDVAGGCTAIVGIGLNVRMPEGAAMEVDQSWVDLASLGLRAVPRNQVARCLLDFLGPALQKFEREGLPGFVSEWERFDVLRGRPVAVVLGDSRIDGVVAGIDAAGGLRLQTPDGERTFSAGEVSVRGWN